MEPTRSDGHTAGATHEPAAVVGCALDSAAVRPFLHALDRPRMAWATGETTLAVGGVASRITATAPNRFDVVTDRATSLFDSLHVDTSLPDVARPRLYGGFSFTDAHSPEPGGTWDGFPAAEFTLPAIQLTLTDDGAWLTAAAVGPGASETASDRLARWRDRFDTLPELDPGPLPGIDNLRYNPSRDTWRTQVEAAMDRIGDGELEKVVLAQSLTADLKRSVSVTDMLSRLSEHYRECYRFLFEPPTGGAFFGATPERLVTVEGNNVETEALAGSIGRGDTPDEDDELATELESSAKDVHEHTLVVDAVCDQLSARTENIRTGERTVRRLANVQHLQTPIRATLDTEEHVLSLVEALHPTPAVGGLPPDDALQTIRETESFDRGWYAAPVGWFDAAGNGTFAVAIRSGIAADHSTTMFAGAGIVEDSDPDGEWDELQLKYRPILDELA
jgi:menaquinone-specific isochorismate synthase